MNYGFVFFLLFFVFQKNPTQVIMPETGLHCKKKQLDNCKQEY